MLHYQVTARGTAYSGTTTFLSSATTFQPVSSFRLDGSFVASSPIDTTNTSRNGVNLLDFGFLFGHPFGSPEAGSILWATNIGLDNSLISTTRTGAGALDDVTQTYDPTTRTLVTRVDAAISQLITSQFFEITGAVFADTYRPLSGEIDITFSADGRSFVGTALLLGVGLIFPGTAAWQVNLTGSSTNSQGVALDTTALIVPAAPGPPPGSGHFRIIDTSTGATLPDTGTAYPGPVAGIQFQFITTTTENLAITATTPNSFIHTGSGTDAIDVSKVNGTNVLDGSTGSNFLVGGSGFDTFFVDDRGPAADVFSTVVGFHTGDNATIIGVTPADFKLNILDGQGAVGFKGLDFGFSAAGKANANLVLTGFTGADLSNGRLTTTFGTNPATAGAPASTFMLIHAN